MYKTVYAGGGAKLHHPAQDRVKWHDKFTYEFFILMFFTCVLKIFTAQWLQIIPYKNQEYNKRYENASRPLP